MMMSPQHPPTVTASPRPHPLTVETLEGPPMPLSHHSNNATMPLSTSSSYYDGHVVPQQQQQDNEGVMDIHNNDALQGGLPSESQLVLLCLDYLRDLRRAYPAEDLQAVEGLNADYLSVAVFALSRVFTRPETLVGDNDCMMDPLKQPPLSPRHINSQQKNSNFNFHDGSNNGSGPIIPSMTVINHEILYMENPHSPEDEDDHGDQKKEEKDDSDPYSWYDYDDMHPSNTHRFYPLSGLASGPSLKGPLTLGEIAAAGLAGLGARSRQDAENDMICSPLFEQFVQAVKSKGFFMDPDNDTPLVDREEEKQRVIRQQKNYDDRYRKVVAKFRTKLAIKAESPQKPGTPLGSSTGASSPMRAANWLALTSADRQRRRREQAMEQARWRKSGGQGAASPYGTPDRMMTPRGGGSTPRGGLNVNTPDRGGNDSGPDSASRDHPVDLEQAERAKAEGNVYMQKKLYPQAVQSYTQALKISPHGPSSHVYFSNRAAALLSMKKFGEAILDSERALALKPDYGKAHARLGLAHFLSGNYRQAMEAYTVSLKYDPNNVSSKSYLEKAAKRLAEGGSSSSSKHQEGGGGIQSSFSLVSEWESGQRQQQQQQQQSYPQRSPSPHHHKQQQSFSSQDGAPMMAMGSMDDRSKSELQRDAEKFKAKGNAFMAHREYTLALEAYTSAIQCSPNGPQSHVYYSNRAAALCYLERYRDAISDSEKSLELSPTYGKAHARLGLSRYFLQDYAGAVAAYTAALHHDPDNAASKSYLAKARAKMEGRPTPSSRNSSPATSHRSGRR